VTLADKHSTQREIGLGYGYEERERRIAKKERDRERSVCHGMMFVVVAVVCFLSLCEAFSLASSVFSHMLLNV
jgi:hypothetical protein